ncbi:Imm1 family immunity protein [Streptomyces venezuelae]|uniref:Imm1 family immunity protein n=1 Tax=Streptomyces venezuelae TaxID=54571 RepID=UPI00278C688F|nr:Imm1 family immunity protein [Streptomyces venezuelae]
MEVEARAYYKSEHTSAWQEIAAPEDVDHVIDFLLSSEKEYHSAAMFRSTKRQTLPSGHPDHEFIVGVNSDSQMGAITFSYDDRNFATVGASESVDELFYQVAGHEAFFPENAEIHIDLIRKAVKEFVFSGGELPTCITWQSVA